MEQLTLLPTPEILEPGHASEVPWDLDEHTRAVGRQGVEQARRALHRSRDRHAA